MEPERVKSLSIKKDPSDLEQKRILQSDNLFAASEWHEWCNGAPGSLPRAPPFISSPSPPRSHPYGTVMGGGDTGSEWGGGGENVSTHKNKTLALTFLGLGLGGEMTSGVLGSFPLASAVTRTISVAPWRGEGTLGESGWGTVRYFQHETILSLSLLALCWG